MDAYSKNINEAIDFAKKVGFPGHGVIVRKNEKSKEIYKDIVSWQDFENIVTKLGDTEIIYVYEDKLIDLK